MIQSTTNRDPQLREIWTGLARSQKSLPAKLFYDAEGCRLFDRICELEEYYPTRTELAIMDQSLPEMAAAIGPQALIVEYGSGSGLKTRRLLAALQDPVGYAPVEIAPEFLDLSTRQLRKEFPALEILPVCADFTRSFAVPRPKRTPQKTVVYFPGSTLGNFEPPEAKRLLANMAEEAGPGGGLLLGLDCVKPTDVLERAYDDAEGVTAAFNLNLLRRLNREFDGDFDLSAFAHQARYDSERDRIEMHLASRRDQQISVAGKRFSLRRGETICTEHSHKFRPAEFAKRAAELGWRLRRQWQDPQRWFAALYFELAR
ncbi:MAG TPA: L-histidine N(alpha)-methyltransferase [Pirellulaceae bacterium]|jgi:dimethylhistidine N-methyltransferase|nr:L-histidine N(alpha)-methyltransferase [Pirellulaceae bacterium]